MNSAEERVGVGAVFITQQLIVIFIKVEEGGRVFQFQVTP